MRRIFIFVAFFLIPFSFFGVGFPQKETQEEMITPNPVDLKANWWDYYETDPKVLVKRKAATEELYTKIGNELSEEDYEKARPLFDRILIGLQTLIDLKETAKIPIPIYKPQDKYTYQEWISLSTKMLEEKEALQYLRLRSDLARSSYRSAEKYVDTRFAAYLKQTVSDPSRLTDGLTIIQGRVSVAIEKIQFSHLEDVVRAKSSNIELLKEAIDASYRKIDFQTVTLENIDGELNRALERQKNANNSYLLSYENVPKFVEESGAFSSYEKEVSDQRLLNAKLEYEISRIEVINLEIQQVIVGWVNKKTKISRKELSRKMEEWKAVLKEIESGIKSSEESSELVLQQSLRTLALQEEGNDQNFSSSESLRLSELAILKIEQLKNALFMNEFLVLLLQDVKREFHFSLFDRFTVLWEGLVSFFQTHAKWFSQSLFKVGDFPVTPLGIIKFIIIAVISYFLARTARHFINYFGKKQNRIKLTSVYILSRVSYYIIIFLGLLIAGSAIGFDLTIFAYVAGAVAIWVGFSLQSIFHNFISGLIVLLTKSLRINDVIELQTGEIGTVSDLNLRTTTLQTFDGKDLVIPNADIVNNKFLNWTLSSHTIRIKVPFRIGHDQDKDAISKLIIEAAKKVEITSASFEPEIWLTGFGPNYIEAQLVVWINTFLRGKTASRESQYFWAIDDALKEQGIELPIPLQDIYIEKEKKPPFKKHSETPPKSPLK